MPVRYLTHKHFFFSAKVLKECRSAKKFKSMYCIEDQFTHVDNESLIRSIRLNRRLNQSCCYLFYIT